MADMTVKQLADELSITTQALHKKINQLPTRLKPSKVKGAYVIKPDTADEIRRNTVSYQKEKQPSGQPSDNQVTTIESLINQLDAKDEQIKELHKLLDQQQQLNLRSTEQINQLQLEVKEHQKPKRKWWQVFK